MNLAEQIVRMLLEEDPIANPEQTTVENPKPISAAIKMPRGEKKFNDFWKNHSAEIERAVRSKAHQYSNIPNTTVKERAAEILRKMVDAVQYYDPDKAARMTRQGAEGETEEMTFEKYANEIAARTMNRMHKQMTKGRAARIDRASVSFDAPRSGEVGSRGEELPSLYSRVGTVQDPAKAAEMAELQGIMTDAVEDLDPRKREFIKAYMRHDKSNEELAREFNLDITRAGVSRMVKRIQAEIGHRLIRAGYDKSDVFSMTDAMFSPPSQSIVMGKRAPIGAQEDPEPESEYERSTKTQFANRRSRTAMAKAAELARYRKAAGEEDEPEEPEPESKGEEVDQWPEEREVESLGELVLTTLLIMEYLS